MNIQGLIVGLGNPGKEYSRTRHNFGFMAVEHLLEVFEKNGTVRVLSGKNDKYHLWRCASAKTPGDWLVCTPLTFMNRSGEAVQRVASYYHVTAEQILAVHDELDLPLGRMKLKKGGGNAGHNGLRSIQQLMGTADFYRLRLGIGKPMTAGTGHVLGRFAEAELPLVNETLDAAIKGIFMFMKMGERDAQQFVNSFSG